MEKIIENFFGYQLSLNPIDWSGVSGISDVLMLLINLFLLITVFHGMKSIRETKMTRDADMMTLVLEQIEPIKSDMYLIRHSGNYSEWCENEKVVQAANRISIGLQRLGYMGLSGMINKRHLIEMWGPSFVQQWKLLEPFVKDLRDKNNEPRELSKGAYSRKDFERFAMASSKYLAKNYKEVSGKFST